MAKKCQIIKCGRNGAFQLTYYRGETRIEKPVCLPCLYAFQNGYDANSLPDTRYTVTAIPEVKDT